MEGLEYYKTLVSDDEVIKALVKDSQAREGVLEKSRVRPNLQFFQRTVTNLVSSNNRVTEKQEEVKAKEKVKHKVYRPRKVYVKKKLPIDYIKEILSTRIEFVKPTEESESSQMKYVTSEALHTKEMGTSSSRQTSYQNLKQKRSFIQKKSPFQQIREILTNNVNDPSNLNPNVVNKVISSKDVQTLRKEQTSDDMDTSCSSKNDKSLKISSDVVITLSDSDSSSDLETDIHKVDEFSKFSKCGNRVKTK